MPEVSAIKVVSAGIVSRAMDRIGVKAALSAIIAVSAWHFTDSGKIDMNHQQVEKLTQRVDYQRAELDKRVESSRYEQDQRELHDDLREIRANQQQMISLELQLQKAGH
jgi:hypothetical protein